MEYICIGVLVNTHALKGEVRIISDFEYKEKVFKLGNNLYIGPNKILENINSYRKHKNYDMVTFVGKNKIEEVINYKGMKVYFNKEDLNLDSNEYLDSDLINLEVIYNGNIIGKIDNIEINANKKLFVINDKLIPYNNNFIEKIDLINKTITLKNLDGLL